MAEATRLFPALLKFWRGRRGLSQLDLALRAGVSARHISFLETGRSKPSVEMVMLLGGTLALPLRDRNELLRAAGFDAEFPEDPGSALDDPAVSRAIEHMLAQQEPYPLFVLDGGYDVLRLNRPAEQLATAALGALPERWNAIRVLFDREGFAAMVDDWESTAREMVWRLHRESLLNPQDERLSDLLAYILDHPTVPDDWREPDLTRPATPAFAMRFRLGELSLGFLTTIMRFTAPSSVVLEELQIESWYPLDDATAAICREMFR